jgi:hypothetical protein
MTSHRPSTYSVEFDGDAFMKSEAIKKAEHALRCIRSHDPPLWDIAAGSLAIALEHVRTLHAIAEKQKRIKPVRMPPSATEGQG